MSIDAITAKNIRIAELEAQVEGLLADVSAFRDYLTSGKFTWNEPQMASSDAMAWTDSIRSNHLDREVEPWGWACDVNAQRESRLNGYRNFARSER